MPRLLNELLGTKFKIVMGYEGREQELLAIERGEAEGRSPGYTTTKNGPQSEWLKQGKLHYMVMFSKDRLKELPDVPSVFEFVDDPEAISILKFVTAVDEFGRPFIAPGGVPADRLAVLREAFAKMSEDPEFIAEMAAQGHTVDYMSGEEVQASAHELMDSSPELIARVKAIRSGN